MLPIFTILSLTDLAVNLW